MPQAAQARSSSEHRASRTRGDSPDTALWEVSSGDTQEPNLHLKRVYQLFRSPPTGSAKSRLPLFPTRYGSLRFSKGSATILPVDRQQAPIDVSAGLTHSFGSKRLGRVEDLRRALVPTLHGLEKTLESKDGKSVFSLVQTSAPKMGNYFAQSLRD